MTIVDSLNSSTYRSCSGLLLHRVHKGVEVEDGDSRPMGRQVQTIGICLHPFTDLRRLSCWHVFYLRACAIIRSRTLWVVILKEAQEKEHLSLNLNLAWI